MSDKAITPADIATITAAIIACITFIVSTSIYIQTTRRERRVKTLDYWETIQPSLIQARKELNEIHKGDWTKEDALIHLESSNLNIIVKGLNAFERLATGINLDVYDLNVLNKLAGKMIIDSYIAYIPLIVAREEQLGEGGIFREFEILYSKLLKIRNR
ncbi:DUF4760 domain-containing protein [Vibrio cholerae]|uniref:DUF4760 domain-containing protein n=1 Tax=Vibrio TaxID=662 RepID=UPI0004E33510|nr:MULTISPECIES: DUF4760 domain-containing protein [Vibrio]EGQ8672453.1 DUF4760 domain-containing protein [Vibrio cholerae]EGQ9463239.1 DUF4760 domain-containing protein [Vibrio cholerae]EGR1090353.1 DUF4760 domain-containing protein [Vibrio cholerae]EGR1329885.1 DUF4760 domain-containing protein [Vibrio cholerae]EGR1447709.1 DUF4760 domain-containing protein [Vibrio cholerae]